ncbi:MAG TPA: CapA family protein [Anaeromyxobacteraceae bacterium]|nr:CapA family protein [Anaeromyxobacteraceae bacterium]
MTAARALALALACGCAAAPRPAPEAGAPPSGAAPAPRPLTAAPAEAAPVRTEALLTLGAVGDVLMHGAVKESAALHRDTRGGDEDGYGWIYAEVSDLLSAPDLTFANLESPIAPASDRGSRSYVFNAPPAAARALRAAGVDLVSVANNHVFDQGRAGFLETLRRLDEAGLEWVGAGTPPAEAGPRLLEAKGLRLAFLAWTRFFNDDGNACAPPGPCLRAALLDPERAVAAVREAAASADAVVVSLHWGDEYAPEPRAEDVALAHRLAEAGALVILGHHPHVLQPVELHRRPDGRVSVIAYSLGNFVSNQSRNFVSGVTPDRAGATRDGALLRVRLARRDYGGGVRQVEVAGVDYLPLWTENDTAELDRRRNPKARASIRVVSLDRALRAVRAELAAIPDPVPEAERARFVGLRQRERLYRSRREAIAAVLGEDLQAEAPPR